MELWDSNGYSMVHHRIAIHCYYLHQFWLICYHKEKLGACTLIVGLISQSTLKGTLLFMIIIIIIPSLHIPPDLVNMIIKTCNY